MSTATLRLSCPIRTGISARVTGFTADRDCIIEEAQQFSDRRTGRFFMRLVFDPQDNDIAQVVVTRECIEDGVPPEVHGAGDELGVKEA